MARCEVCGNEYRRAFQVTVDDVPHTFDSFECAIHLLAPTCQHCGCRVIGHGVEAGGVVYCCESCARMSSNVERAATASGGAEAPRARGGNGHADHPESLTGQDEMAHLEKQADGDPADPGAP